MWGEIPKFSLQDLCVPTKNPPESENEHLTAIGTTLEVSIPHTEYDHWI